MKERKTVKNLISLIIDLTAYFGPNLKMTFADISGILSDRVTSINYLINVSPKTDLHTDTYVDKGRK